MTRKQALTAIMVAGYKGDKAAATSIYINNRLSMAAYQKAWQAGMKRREQEENTA